MSSNEQEEKLKALSESLANPGIDALYRASQRQKLGLTKKQVADYVATRSEKQVFESRQPAKGKIAAETLDARWQVDIAIWFEDTGTKKTSEKYPVYFVVAVNIGDRFIYAARTWKKEPGDIILALETILSKAPKKPKVVSSDQEFAANKIQRFFEAEGIVQRFKEPGVDFNSLGLIDRSIQLIKQRLAEGDEAGSDAPWSTRVDSVVKSLNATPKPEVLHNNAPEEIRENPEARFLLQQDNAEKLQQNESLTKKRLQALDKAGGRFRIPTTTRSAFKRGFQPSFEGRVRLSEGVVAGRIKSGGQTYSLKSVRPAR